ncbi:hypothetical protein QQF64_018258 [Cirrhinus molitorella]|uniref:Uncharacterized protein n=1 Tax=Cirrhinus molitorella TaxID=172907 RepID=A0ABR3LKX0_9TELE
MSAPSSDHTEPGAFSSSLSVYSGLEPSRSISPNPAAACGFDEAVTRMSSISPSVSLCAGVPASLRGTSATLSAAGDLHKALLSWREFD